MEAHRRLVVAVVAAARVAGMALTGLTRWVLLPACIMAFVMDAPRPLFWALPSLFLSRTATTTGIALINSIGNLGGIIGPVVVGWVKDAPQSFAGGLYCIAVVTALAGILVMLIGPRHVTAPPSAALAGQ